MERNKGVVIVLSDFFDKGDLSEALRYLGGPRHDAYAIQLLAPQETDPARGEITGDLRLVDVEDANAAEVSVTPALIRRYKANLEAYCDHLRQECLKRGAAYLMTETSTPFDQLVLRYFRERGLVG
jgi:hypothetical protein